MTEQENDQDDGNNVKMNYAIVGFAVVLLLGMTVVGAVSSFDTSDNENEIPDVDRQEVLESSDGTTVAVFYGEGCPSCSDMNQFIQEETEDTENISVKQFEVWENNTNEILYERSIDSGHMGVPAVQIGDETWFGYSQNIRDQIADKIDECEDDKCGVPETYDRNAESTY